MGDVEKMYRQVWLSTEDRDKQRILWYIDGDLRILQLNTVTFGVSSSAFLAIRTIHQLAEDESHDFPRAAKILKNHMYVDDLVTFADSVSEGLEIRKEVTEVLNRGGFNIRQWASNDPRILDGLPADALNTKLLLHKDGQLKTLGVSWDSKEDSICYSVSPVSLNDKVTKRSVLSEIAKIFDPLGLLGPVILYAKTIMQLLWKRKLDWKESLPQDLFTKWQDFITELNLINGLKFKRKVLLTGYTTFELHGFCDASETGYGACIYVRSENARKRRFVLLLTAKSKVCPVKPPASIPRAELLAAVTLARLYEKVIGTVKCNVKSFFWSDSTIALQWIQKPPHTLQTFVSNRVSVIQEKTNIKNWRHVAGVDNPADALSRGQLSSVFLKNETWSKGPRWLSGPQSEWPRSIIEPKDDLPEMKRACCFAINSVDEDYLARYSYSQLLRILSYCIRFFEILKRKREIKQNNKVENETLRQRLNDELKSEPLPSGFLTVAEIVKTEKRLLKNIQNTHFHDQIHCIKNKIQLKGLIPHFKPFIDKDGLLRVGGRIEKSDLSYMQKHQILLPSHHALTDNIIREIHLNNHHSGVQTTFHLLRQKFWLFDGHKQVRSVIRKCIPCFKFSAKPVDYVMGDLPASRMQVSRPFLYVGTDFCGPFFIKEKKFRNRGKEKIYVCIFICMSTKAVHLEVVSEITTKAFIGALSRFTSRRGLAAHIFSDNGSNYIGTNNKFQEIYSLLNSESHKDQVNQFALKNRITWHFTPPLSPHFNGICEATVKIFKHHLKRVIGDLLLTYEHFETLTVEIEGILNSRPLYPMSSDPNDLLAMSPAQHLIGEPLNPLPENDVLDIPANRLDCWDHLKKVRQDFWSRFRLDCLNEFQMRKKWVKDGVQLKEGMMVLLKDKTVPCFHWPLARVVEVHPGEDGIVRVATVKTANSIHKRSVKLLCPLPFESRSNFYDTPLI